MPQLVNDPQIDEIVDRFNKIESLREEARRLLVRIREVYSQIGAVAAGGRVERRGAKGYADTTAAGPRRRGRRGELKAALHKVLAGGKTLRPADIIKALPKAGYKAHSTPRVLYNTVYLTLTKDKAVQKTPEGFKLKG